MMMGLSMTCAASQRLVQAQRLALTQTQRAAIQCRMLALRMELAGALVEEQYENKRMCPHCHHGLTMLEQLRGFAQSDTDTLCTCPKCKHRFQPRLVAQTLGGTMEIILLCPQQTLYELRKPLVNGLEPTVIRDRHPAAYRGALIHFGSLTLAFHRAGLEYGFPEVYPWEDKVVPFLGKMSDTDIARACRVSEDKIRRFRKKKGIKAFRKRALAEELGV